MLAQQILSLVKAARYYRGARLFVAEFVGGYRITVQRFEEKDQPSLPPPPPVPTYTTTAEPARATRPGLARAIPRTNVVPLRRKVG